MSNFAMVRDINGYNSFGLPFSEYMYNTTLASGVAQTLTVPSDYPKWIVVFGYEVGATVWVAHNATAAIPSVAFAKIVSEVAPVARSVKAGDTLSFITPDTNAQVGVIFYAL